MRHFFLYVSFPGRWDVSVVGGGVGHVTLGDSGVYLCMWKYTIDAEGFFYGQCMAQMINELRHPVTKIPRQNISLMHRDFSMNKTRHNDE